MSVSGYQYYFVILDVYTHFLWTFPVRHQYEVHRLLVLFYAYGTSQFSHPILAFQTNNGREFDNLTNRALLGAQGTLLRLTCPYTFQQNGKAERVLHTSPPHPSTPQSPHPSTPRGTRLACSPRVRPSVIPRMWLDLIGIK